MIDAGITAAKWSPDRNSLLIATNNDTLLLMNCYFDVLYEVPISERLPKSPCSLSWRGDGESFALLSVDRDDVESTGTAITGVKRIRIYNKELILTATGSNIATDPAASVLRGLGEVVAFATNGLYVCVPQQRVKGRPQVPLSSSNGMIEMRSFPDTAQGCLVGEERAAPRRG